MKKVCSTKILTPEQKTLFPRSEFHILDNHFIATQSIDFQIDYTPNLLIFSSQNAVKSLLKHPRVKDLQSIPCICIGQKTQQFLAHHHFTVVLWETSADRLVQKLSDFPPDLIVVYFCGNLRREILPSFLSSYFYGYTEITAYQTTLTPIKLNNFSADAVLFFSPSEVRSFLMQNSLVAPAFCIGKTTANEVISLNGTPAFFPPFPSVEATIEMCISYFNTNTENFSF